MPQLQANIKLKAMSGAAENILHLVTANLKDSIFIISM
jgi:hypothetical protein